ncbi:MAG: GntR family transcriptional regulator [Propionibacteriaceae bacterium]|nr:GntR family transcriptional regulator [Propionibacteriaceae bacterium]
MSGDFTPLYAGIAQDLRSQILGGAMALGSKIPSENELMVRYHTTRGTARAAVDLLVDEGLVRRERGRGTFVVLRPVRHRVLNFGGFTDSVRSLHEVALSRVVESVVEASADGPQLKLVRLRGVARNGTEEVASLDTSYLSLRRFPGLDAVDFEGRSLYQTLRENYGVYPRRTLVSLRTHRPSDRERTLLQEPADGTDLLLADGHGFDQFDQPFERMLVLYPSRTEFTFSTPIDVGGATGIGKHA